MNAHQSRRPSGTPTGGQFAGKTRPEPGYSLDPDCGGPVDAGGMGFSPADIREHFEAIGASVEDLSDEQLRSVAADALGDDRLSDTYHRVLDSAVRRARESRPPVLDHVAARRLPSYTEVSAEFSVIPGRRFRLMARGMPAGPGDSNPRRFTNLDTGTEVFVPADGAGGDGRPLFAHVEIAGPR